MLGLDAANAAAAQAVFSLDGASVETVDTMKYDGTYCVASYAVTSKQMNDAITMELYIDGALAATNEYKITDYLNIVENTAGFSEKLVRLCESMMDYGTYSQRFFAHNTGNLPNGGVDRIMETVPSGIGTMLDREALNGQFAETDWDIAFYGANLKLDSDTDLNLYFTYSGSAYKSLSVTVNDSPAEFDIDQGMLVVSIQGIISKRIGNAQTIAITDGETTVTFQYSAYNYVNNVVTGSNMPTWLPELCTAIYHYCECAKAYFGG